MGAALALVVGISGARGQTQDEEAVHRFVTETEFLGKALSIDTAPEYCLKYDRDEFDQCLFVQRGERDLMARELKDMTKSDNASIMRAVNKMATCIVGATAKAGGPDYASAVRCYNKVD